MPAAFPIRRQIDWRLESANQRLAVALAISLLLHALAYTGWKVAPATVAFLKEAFERVVPASRMAKQLEVEKPPQQPPREVPMVFVEIDPALATPEPPKETPNYATANSIAANPQPKKADVPKIDGTQVRVMSSAEPSKPQPKPLQPSPPPPKPPEPKPPEPEPEETKAPEKPVEPKPPEPKPKSPAPPGDLALAKATPKAPELTPNPEGEKPAPKPRARPRTLQEARARNPSLAADQTRQDGGVERQAQVAMFDARGSVFGEYDSVFVSIVRARWYQLLNENKYMMDRRGKVTLSFRIYHDGRISDPSILENTVGDMLSLLCYKAILDPAPFPKWPAEMRRQIKLQSNAESREVKFTFYYD